MKRRYMLSLIFLILFSSLIYGQDEDENWFIGKPIKDLVFDGLEVIPLNDLRPLVKDYIGEKFTLELFWEIHGNLLALEYFEDIEANAKEGDEERSSVIIEFKVTEHPAVSVIKVTGNKKISTSDIIDVIGVKEGDFLNEAQVKIDELSISDFYLEEGFRKITVSSRLEKDEDTNFVIVYFDINEGYKTTIKAIDFTGNEFASATTLRGKLKQKKQGLFESGIFQENLLEEDKARIVEYYKAHGYLDALVEKVARNIDDAEEKERSYVSLVFYVVEGKQYTLGKLSIAGNKIFTEKDIRDLIRQKSGEPVNMVKLEQDFQKVRFLYTDDGYIFNTIDLIPTRDEENRIVDFELVIVEKDKAHIANIILEGNEKTKDYVIFRELPFEAGDIFSTEKLRNGYFNLYNLEYFSNIVMNPIQSDVEGLMDLVINVEEKSWADFKFAVAFSGGDFPVSGTFGWADSNLGGTGRTLGVDLEFSNMRQGLSGKFQDNYLFADILKGWGGGVSLSFYHTLIRNVPQDIIGPIFTDESVPDPYTSLTEFQEASGNDPKAEYSEALKMSYDSIDLSLGGNTGWFTHTPIGMFQISTGLNLALEYLWYDDEIYRPYDKVVRDDKNKFALTNGWSNSVKLDKREIFHNPVGGYLLRQDVILAGGPDFFRRHYVRTKTTAEWFLTLFKIPVAEVWAWQMVLALHADASFMFPFMHDEVIAEGRQRMVIDGMNIGRGWSPVIERDESMFNFSLELRTPIFQEFLWGIMFADAVAMWDTAGDFFSVDSPSTMVQDIADDFYFSAGIGLKLTMPGLPLRVYLSQPFRYSQTDGWSMPPGNFPLWGLEPKFVLAIGQPGGF